MPAGAPSRWERCDSAADLQKCPQWCFPKLPKVPVCKITALRCSHSADLWHSNLYLEQSPYISHVGMCQILHLPEVRMLSWLISCETQPELLGMAENYSVVVLSCFCQLKMFKLLINPCKKTPQKVTERNKPQKPSLELFVLYSLSHRMYCIHSPFQGQV